MKTLIKLMILMLTISFLSRSKAQVPNGFFVDEYVVYQQSTNLKWLKVTLTQGKSYQEISAYLASGRVPLNNGLVLKNGWRYATTEEFRLLIEDWFNINFLEDVFQHAPFGNNDHLIVETFITSFGDTQAAYLLSKQSHTQITQQGSGGIKGLLATSPRQKHWHKYVALVLDSEMFNHAKGINVDQQDLVSINNTQPTISPNLQIGSFLVKEY